MCTDKCTLCILIAIWLTVLNYKCCKRNSTANKIYFTQVVSLLYPLRYNIVHLGGSRAQRYVIIVTLIHAAINSGQYKLALSLTAELKVSKGAVKCMLFVDIIIMADNWPFYLICLSHK